jgi:DNA polymerase III subunit gamma/tau
MSYQVIARKYRPQRFSDVVGQEHVTQTLANAVAQNRIAHAYLFCGPRGTGKTTIARIFAKCLNCTGGPKTDFADDDPRCLEITEGRSIDVLEIDGASNNGVEQVRELRETVKYAPASSKFKIYIIDEVHMLSTAAFSALLKTLEEPPAHVKFMFATTDPEKVLPTILSRCQRFDLRRIPSGLIVQQLRRIAELEQVRIDDTALLAIARGADGGMRDAESTLDQLISFCGGTIEESDVLSMFGLTAQAQILALSRAVLAGEIEPALRQVDELTRNGKDIGRLLSDLLSHFRNLLLYRVSRGDRSLLEVSEAEGASLAEQSGGTSAEVLSRILEVLSGYETRLRDAASRRILLEVALLKAMEARNAVSVDRLLQRLQDLRSDGAAVPTGGSPAAVPAPRSVSPRQPAPQSDLVDPPGVAAAPSEPPSEVSPGALELEALWGRVVEAVGRVSPFARSYLLEAHPVSLTAHLLTIGFDPEFADHLELVDNAKNRTLIQTKLKELGGGDAQVKFIRAEAPEGRAAGIPAPPPMSPPAPRTVSVPVAEAPAVPARPKPGPVPFDPADFKNDPLIQKALEIFKGQIVEVRG